MTWLTDPADWWITPFVDNLFLRDTRQALLTVACTSVIGTWVVLRGSMPRRCAGARRAARYRDRARVLGAPTTRRAGGGHRFAKVGGVQLIRTGAAPARRRLDRGVVRPWRSRWW
ncbi:MAG: hypothetical protein R2697_03065 [Ilumatobacteraceae bacterium]